VELGALAKRAVRVVGTCSRVSDVRLIANVASTLAASVLDSSWHTRAAVLTFVTLFRAHHLFLLPPTMDASLIDLVRGGVHGCGWRSSSVSAVCLCIRGMLGGVCVLGLTVFPFVSSAVCWWVSLSLSLLVQVVDRLKDKQVDVQQLASETLVGLLMTASIEHQKAITQPFFKLARTKLPSPTAASSGSEADRKAKKKVRVLCAHLP